MPKFISEKYLMKPESLIANLEDKDALEKEPHSLMSFVGGIWADMIAIVGLLIFVMLLGFVFLVTITWTLN